MRLSGGCQCGTVRFQVDGELHYAAVCHCPSCRKSAGAPIVGWALFEADCLQTDRSRLSVYKSSPGVRRSFCGHCGTTLFFEADYLEGLVDITTESFDDPDSVRPWEQIWTQHRTDCVKGLADMPGHHALPPQG